MIKVITGRLVLLVLLVYTSFGLPQCKLLGLVHDVALTSTVATHKVANNQIEECKTYSEGVGRALILPQSKAF